MSLEQDTFQFKTILYLQTGDDPLTLNTFNSYCSKRTTQVRIIGEGLAQLAQNQPSDIKTYPPSCARQ